MKLPHTIIVMPTANPMGVREEPEEEESVEEGEESEKPEEKNVAEPSRVVANSVL